MDTSKNRRSAHDIPVTNADHAHVADAAADLVHESQKRVNELYEEGLHKMHEAQAHVSEYSQEIVDKVREKPLTSLLIAAGAGFILSSLLRK